MADVSWGEVVGGTIAGIAGGALTVLKALKGKTGSNGNGHVGRSEWHALDKRVSFIERDYEAIKHTLESHDLKLDDIREDLSKIMAAVDRRED